MGWLHTCNNWGPVPLEAAYYPREVETTSESSYTLQIARLENLRMLYARSPCIHVRSRLS